ncbi:hypothetical protein [Salinicoccus sp. CNSTN-B1]
MKRKIFYGILIVLLVALVVIGVYIYNLFNSFERGFRNHSKPPSATVQNCVWMTSTLPWTALQS